MTHRTIFWNTPYTFSGKEKDVETGYGYVKKLRFFSSLAFGNGKQVSHYTHCLRRFGARYYDSGLSIWLSVDPMSDKYSNMSPYNYCTNNPVILVDPDGNSPKDPIDVWQLVSGIGGVVGGGLMWVSGVAQVIAAPTTAGASAVSGGLTITYGSTVFGLGVANIIDACTGGKRDIPTSPATATARAVEKVTKIPNIENTVGLAESILSFNKAKPVESATVVVDLFITAMSKKQSNNNNNNKKNNNNSNKNNNNSNNNKKNSNNNSNSHKNPLKIVPKTIDGYFKQRQIDILYN